MPCKELVETITDYLEDTMDAAERERLEAHLEKCPGCVAFVEQMRTSLRALVAAGVEQVGEERQKELLDVFRSWKAPGESADDD
jgi:anti-sigma factor RsiW